MSAVKVMPAEAGEGIMFSFGSRRCGIREASADGTRRCTSLSFPGGISLCTVEHLLAAIIGTGLDDIIIEPDGDEFPILDGSALPFASDMVERGFEESDVPRGTPSIVSCVCVEDGASSATAVPSDELRITYIIDYPGTAIGTELKDVVMTEESFLNEIAPARTFCLESEVKSLRESGLARGGTLDNALIIGDDGPIGSGYRVEKECAAHKITDLLGDMALAGFTANAHYICVRAGHSLHSRLVRRVARGALNNSGR
jgi:UDP-3-O-[3-hydroxymyristoyl] N-acetylglucosamine deacetylase